MATSVRGIETRLMDEPHVVGHRVSARRIHTLVEENDRNPSNVADSLRLDVADIYCPDSRTLKYPANETYHNGNAGVPNRLG